MHSPKILAILNVTPDSYVDGGRWMSLMAAEARARQCREEGADIIEIGGQSTGPGSIDITCEEELKRVLPVVHLLRASMPDAVLSVDTYRADVAGECLAAGVSMINDVTAGRGDPAMLSVIARAECDYVVMYAKDDSPRTTREDKRYDDVIATCKAFLRERKKLAMEAGIARNRIIVDPGLGHFVSALPEYSFRILSSIHEFSEIGPVLVSPSRKSFLAGSLNLPVEKRLPATLAATVIAARGGAAFIRTHDVLETKQALMVLASVMREEA